MKKTYLVLFLLFNGYLCYSQTSTPKKLQWTWSPKTEASFLKVLQNEKTLKDSFRTVQNKDLRMYDCKIESDIS